MLIHLVRHGDASSDQDLKDSERPLTDRGKQQASLVAEFLKKMNIHIDTIISSPLLRAQQTASIIQKENNLQQPVISNLFLNGTDEQELLRYFDSLSVSSVLAVGHIPHLENIITMMVNGKSINSVIMKKCSLAIIETPKPIYPGGAQLKQLIHVDKINDIINS